METRLIETSFPQVRLKVLPGVEVPEKIIKRFLKLAARFFRWKVREEKIEKVLTQVRDEIVRMATENNLRGVETENFTLNVFPRERVVWNFEKLKAILKNFYPLVVKEDRVITITIPAERAGRVESIRKALSEINIPPEWIREGTLPTLDEKRLNEITKRYSIDISRAKESSVHWVVSVSKKS
jgi:hypothetical protein